MSDMEGVTVCNSLWPVELHSRPYSLVEEYCQPYNVSLLKSTEVEVLPFQHVGYMFQRVVMATMLATMLPSGRKRTRERKDRLELQRKLLYPQTQKA